MLLARLFPDRVGAGQLLERAGVTVELHPSWHVSSPLEFWREAARLLRAGIVPNGPRRLLEAAVAERPEQHLLRDAAEQSGATPPGRSDFGPVSGEVEHFEATQELSRSLLEVLLGRLSTVDLTSHWVVSLEDHWSESRYVELAVSSDRDPTWGAATLDTALERHDEPLTVLEGEAGSGKSVSLREVARRRYDEALRNAALPAILPIYVNLRELAAGQALVDSSAVESCAMDQLAAGCEGDLRKFAEAEFRRRSSSGGLFFIFDSFDEIAGLLDGDLQEGSDKYSRAIQMFLAKYPRCRAVIAAREVEGPHIRGVPHLSILPMDDSRRRLLIRRSGRGAEFVSALLKEVSAADPRIRRLAGNPTFLALLCLHAERHGTLPAGAYRVVQEFVRLRAHKEAAKLQRIFGTTADELLDDAATLAYVMSSSPEAGLNPPLDVLGHEYAALGHGTAADVTVITEALVHLGLAVLAPDQGGEPGRKRFSFRDRSLQGYFSTAYVEKHVGSVDPGVMVRRAIWHDTAVFLLESASVAAPRLVTEIGLILSSASTSTSKSQSVTKRQPGDVAADHSPAEHGIDHSRLAEGLRAIKILDESRIPAKLLPAVLVRDATRLLCALWATGNLLERRQALQVVGAWCPTDGAVRLIGDGLRSGSEVLREIAFQRAGYLQPVPPDIRTAIRRSVTTLGAERRLRAGLSELTPRLRRLGDPADFTVVDSWGRALSWILPIALLAAAVPSHDTQPTRLSVRLLVTALLVILLQAIRGSPPLSWWPNRSVTARVLATRFASNRPPTVTLWSSYLLLGACTTGLTFAGATTPVSGVISAAAVGYIVALTPCLLLVLAADARPAWYAFVLPWIVLGHARLFRSQSMAWIGTASAGAALTLLSVVLPRKYLTPDHTAISALAIGSALTYLLLIRPLLRFVVDQQDRQKIRPANLAPLRSASDLLDLLSCLHSATHCVTALSTVRERMILQPVAENVAVVADLLDLVRNAHIQGRKAWSFWTTRSKDQPVGRSPASSTWAGSRRGRRCLRRLGKDALPALDELVRLYDELSATPQTASRVPWLSPVTPGDHRRPRSSVRQRPLMFGVQRVRQTFGGSQRETDERHHGGRSER